MKLSKICFRARRSLIPVCFAFVIIHVQEVRAKTVLGQQLIIRNVRDLVGDATITVQGTGKIDHLVKNPPNPVNFTLEFNAGNGDNVPTDKFTNNIFQYGPTHIDIHTTVATYGAYGGAMRNSNILRSFDWKIGAWVALSEACNENIATCLPVSAKTIISVRDVELPPAETSPIQERAIPQATTISLELPTKRVAGSLFAETVSPSHSIQNLYSWELYTEEVLGVPKVAFGIVFGEPGVAPIFSDLAFSYGGDTCVLSSSSTTCSLSFVDSVIAGITSPANWLFDPATNSFISTTDIDFPTASVVNSTSPYNIVDGLPFADDSGIETVPAPLPLLGVGAALGFSRKLRKRIKSIKTPEVMSAID